MTTELSQLIRIMLVDDHVLFREGVTSLLKRDGRFEIVSEANDGDSAMEIIKQTNPDIVLMDIQMPGIGGIEATRRILAAYSDIKVIIITVSEKNTDLFEAIKAGAQGYILKTVTESKVMCDAIISVATGEAIIPAAMAASLLAEFASLAQNQPGKDSTTIQNNLTENANPGDESISIEANYQTDSNLLTPREFQVLELVALGLKNKEIAVKLVISENTVRSHLRCILDKLHLNNRVQAALWLQKQKLTPSK